MTKKKKGFFSKIKDKVSQKRDMSADDSTDIPDFSNLDNQADIAEPSEFSEVTAEIDISEQSEFQETTAEIDLSEQSEFPEEEDSSEIESLLESEDHLSGVPEFSEDQNTNEDDEVFTPSEFQLSETQKDELSEIPTLEETEQSFEEVSLDQLDTDEQAPTDDEYPAEDHDYGEEEYFPPSKAQRLQMFISTLRSKVNKVATTKKPSIGREFLEENLKTQSKNVRDKLKALSSGSFNWNEFVDDVFSPDNRDNIHKKFIFLLIISTTYMGGRFAALFLEHSSSSKKITRRQTQSKIRPPSYRVELRKISTANLFNTKDPKVEKVIGSPAPLKVDESLICRSSSTGSRLPIKLMNTVVLQDSIKSVASVQIRGKKEVLDIREGGKISNIATIGKIDRLKIIFKNLKTGTCEYIENYDKKTERILSKNPINVVDKATGRKLMKQYKDGRIKNIGNQYKIKKSLRDEMLSNISEVLTQAKAVQIKNSDGTIAFKMTEITPGSIYSKLSIQDGDIITGMNGKKFTNLNDIMTQFGKIKEVNNYEITIRRDGAETNLEYSFE